MIFSSQSVFGSKFSSALPINTNFNSAFLPNDIDLGASMIPVHGKTKLGRDIGGGTPIPVFFMVNEISNNAKLKVRFDIFTSDLPDSGYVEIVKSAIGGGSPYDASTHTITGEIAPLRYMVLGAKRYLRARVEWKAIAAPPANSIIVVTAALGTIAESYEELM